MSEAGRCKMEKLMEVLNGPSGSTFLPELQQKIEDGVGFAIKGAKFEVELLQRAVSTYKQLGLFLCDHCGKRY